MTGGQGSTKCVETHQRICEKVNPCRSQCKNNQRVCILMFGSHHSQPIGTQDFRQCFYQVLYLLSQNLNFFIFYPPLVLEPLTLYIKYLFERGILFVAKAATRNFYKVLLHGYGYQDSIKGQTSPQSLGDRKWNLLTRHRFQLFYIFHIHYNLFLSSFPIIGKQICLLLFPCPHFFLADKTFYYFCLHVVNYFFVFYVVTFYTLPNLQDIYKI